MSMVWGTNLSPAERSPAELECESRAPSMRLRIALLVAALSMLIILAQSATLLLMFDDMEETLIDDLLATQVEHSIEFWRSNPAMAFPNTPAMTLYRLAPDSPRGSVPERLASLPIGNHEIYEDGKEFHVAVREADGARFILNYDVAEHEERLNAVNAIVATGALVIGAAVLALVYTLSGRLTRRLEWLARRVRGSTPAAQGYVQPGMERELLEVAWALEALEARQAQLLARERDFTANLSHELRTPLTAIRTDGEMLAAQAALPESSRRRAQRIVDNTDRISRLAESLLFLARETRPQLQEQLRLSLEIQALWETLESQYEGPVSLQLDIPEPALVRADPAMLQLVLRNLLENALRHTGSGQVVCRLQGSVLQVCDQGPGFAPEDLPRVFERFFRRGAASGHGLGLALVAHVCHACGWSITAANGPEGGAVLSLDLQDSLQLPEAG